MTELSGAKKFSYEDMLFEAEQDRTAQICAELEAYVTGLMSSAVGDSMRQIVDALNSMGHHLSLDSSGVGEFAYVDESRTDGSNRLRLAIDYTISAGFERTEPTLTTDGTVR